MSRPRLRGAADACRRFALAPASPRPLAALRMGLAGVLLGQAAQAAPGLLSGPLRAPLDAADPLSLQRLAEILAPLGAREGHVLAGAGVAYVIALVSLLLGYRARLSAALAFMTHALLAKGAGGAPHGADQLSQVGLFFLVFMPCGRALSIDRRRLKAPPAPTPGARLALRVLQVHLCVVSASSGLGKARGAGWWSGEALGKALPAFPRLDFSFLVTHPWLAAAIGWAVVLVEIGVPLLMWPKRTRRAWVLVTAALHLAVAVFMGLGVFGAIMIVLTIAAFGVRADPDPEPDPKER
ncbi:MAG: HTTM domain-containing protein [Minicystis sp.]